MDLTFLLILTLATWRISSLFVSEDGPFGIFAKLRAVAGISYDEYSNAYTTTFWGGLFNCIFCFSVWAGAAWVLFYWLTPAWAFWIALPFALSAGAIMVDKWTQ